MRDAKARQPLAALFADVFFHVRDLDGVAHEVGGGHAVRHDVVRHDLHGVERAQPPPVRAVAPGGVIGIVEVYFCADHGQKPRQQQQDVRQHRQDGSKRCAELRAAVIQRHAQRRRVHQHEKPRVARVAGDDKAIHGCKRRIGDPAQQHIARADAHRRDARAEIHCQQHDRDGRAI